MKPFIVSLLALAASLSLVTAAPSQELRRGCDGGIVVTFIGAENDKPDDQYQIWVPFGQDYPNISIIISQTKLHQHGIVAGNGISEQIAAIGISTVVYDHNLAKRAFIGKNSPVADPTESILNQWTGQLRPPQQNSDVTCYYKY